MSIFEIASLVAIVTGVVSLLVAIWKRGNKEGVTETQVRELLAKMNQLPCVKNPTYLINIGELNGTVANLANQMQNLNQRLDDVLRDGTIKSLITELLKRRHESSGHPGE